MKLDSRISEYCRKADEVKPEDALRRLCELYITACGMSVGERSMAVVASHYWIHRYNELHPDEPELKSLKDAMDVLSEEYRNSKEWIDRYHPAFLDPKEILRIYSLMMDDYEDEQTRITLSMGILFYLSFILSEHEHEEQI